MIIGFDPYVRDLWLIGQAFRISYRHMLRQRWRVLLMFCLIAAGYTGLFLLVLVVRVPVVFAAHMLDHSMYIAGICMSLIVFTSLSLAAVSARAYRSRARDMTVRKLYGGTGNATVASVFVEFSMIVFAAFFVALVAAEWWVPALAGGQYLHEVERHTLFGTLLLRGAWLFLVYIVLGAALPAYILVRRSGIPKLLRKIDCGPKING